ncbi:MAG: branched-chain amino acid ABC transporter permease [Thermodesulfobacteriota bacterium]|nr:branched-chain amino acid ABC transporter permease [Thermodesulfobacteriota bacterium]
MTMEKIQLFIQIIVSGLALGSIYALIALGFVVIYKATDVFNFAQGELMMVGAYLCFTFSTQLQLPFLYSFLLTLVFSAILSIIIEVLIIRPMVGEPMFSAVMVTLGLSFILQGIVGLIWGYDEHKLRNPFPDQPVSIGGVAISYEHLWTFVTTAILMTIFFLFFKHSKMGMGMRATAEDTDTAFLMGIDVKRIFTLSWVIAAVIASVGGIFLASVSYVKPIMSFVGLRAFPAIILGGMDSIPGAILGGLIIGVTENLTGGYLDHLLGGGVKEITAFVVVILIMMIRPYGLFGTEQIERV